MKMNTMMMVALSGLVMSMNSFGGGQVPPPVHAVAARHASGPVKTTAVSARHASGGQAVTIVNAVAARHNSGTEAVEVAKTAGLDLNQK
jgi:hypothetical protein